MNICTCCDRLTTGARFDRNSEQCRFCYALCPDDNGDCCRNS